jgi:hypothetical protein
MLSRIDRNLLSFSGTVAHLAGIKEDSRAGSCLLALITVDSL